MSGDVHDTVSKLFPNTHWCFPCRKGVAVNGLGLCVHCGTDCIPLPEKLATLADKKIAELTAERDAAYAIIAERDEELDELNEQARILWKQRDEAREKLVQLRTCVRNVFDIFDAALVEEGESTVQIICKQDEVRDMLITRIAALLDEVKVPT